MKREERERADAALKSALERFQKASSDHRELVRSIVPDAEKADTGRFTVPPAPPVPRDLESD